MIEKHDLLLFRHHSVYNLIAAAGSLSGQVELLADASIRICHRVCRPGLFRQHALQHDPQLLIHNAASRAIWHWYALLGLVAESARGDEIGRGAVELKIAAGRLDVGAQEFALRLRTDHKVQEFGGGS